MNFDNTVQSITPDLTTVLIIGGVGALAIPVGATADRPANSPGLIRHNSDTGFLEYNTGASWSNFGNGTVTSISVTTSAGVSGTSSGGATPSLTLTLGNITPTSVASTGIVSGTTITASTGFSGPGSSITALNASNLTTGTVPIARLGTSGTPSSTTFLRGDNTWATPAGGGGGSSSFITLTDAPSSYSGQGLKFVRVNSDESAVEFIEPPNTLQAIASENLTAGQFVNLCDSSGFKVRKASKVIKLAADGFVLSSVTSGATATVYLSGQNTAVTGLTVGRVYLDASGAVTSTIPTTDMFQLLGFAISSTRVVFARETPIILS